MKSFKTLVMIWYYCEL